MKEYAIKNRIGGRGCGSGIEKTKYVDD